MAGAMVLQLVYAAVMVLGLVIGVASRRDRLLPNRRMAGGMITTLGWITVLGILFMFVSVGLSGAILGATHAMANGAAGTVLGNWLRASLDGREYIARHAHRKMLGGAVTRADIVEDEPDDELYTKYGTGRFVLWCCLAGLPAPLVLFLGAVRTGFQGQSVTLEVVAFAASMTGSATLIYFGYRLWSERVERDAGPAPAAGI
jgi:hypothetical protein